MDDEKWFATFEEFKDVPPPSGVSIDIRNSSLLPLGDGGFIPWPQDDLDNVKVGAGLCRAILMCLMFRRRKQIQAIESFVLEVADSFARKELRVAIDVEAPWLGPCVDAIRAGEGADIAPLSSTDPTDLFPFLKGSRYQFLNGNPYHHLYGTSNESRVRVEIRPEPSMSRFTAAEGTITAFTSEPHRLVGIATARAIFACFKDSLKDQIEVIEGLLLGTTGIAGFPEKLQFETWAPCWLVAAVDSIREKRHDGPPSG